MLTMIFRKIF